MIHSTDVSQSNEEFERHSIKSTKHIFRSRHAKSNHRKSHHRRSGGSFNAIKFKSKYQKKTNLSRIDQDQSSLDTNILLENKISFDTCAMVRDHRYLSIIGLLCFFPTGIFGLIRAIQAYEMKRPSSLVYWPKLAAIYGRHALRWAILSILIGTIFWIIFIIYHVLREQQPLW